MIMHKTREATYSLDTWIEPTHTTVYGQVPPKLIHDGHKVDYTNLDELETN